MAQGSIPAIERFTFGTHTHGSGGFARVIKGRDNVLERDVAVKELTPLATAFPEDDQERFRREARILASLSHPNIPAIYDVDFSGGKFVIIFQFIDGITLRQIISEQGPCQISEIKVWFHQIASALEYAHKLGIVHRDIKPENIIITQNRESAYLVDFGIALSAEDVKKLTSSGFVLGTAGYMSPEQQAGEKVDSRTDIYSLAVTLYEALSGKAIPVGHYEPLSSVNEAIPPEIDNLIEDCLRTKEQRLNSLKILTSRLAGALKPARPLSEVLAHGRLNELASSIELLTDVDFSRLPEGQRALILTKVADIVSSGDSRLDYASERLLELLLTRGLLLDKEDYREIVTPAIRWAFAKEFDGYLGRPSVRRALEAAADAAKGDNHAILKDEFASFLSEIDLSAKDDWYLHAVREILEALLANPAAVDGTSGLVAVLKKVNKIQRSKIRVVSSEVA